MLGAFVLFRLDAEVQSAKEIKERERERKEETTARRCKQMLVSLPPFVEAARRTSLFAYYVAF